MRLLHHMTATASPSPLPVSGPVAAIHAEALTACCRGERQLTILDDVSPTVAAGETLVIVWPSGSTAPRCSGLPAGLDRPNSGRGRVARRAWLHAQRMRLAKRR